MSSPDFWQQRKRAEEKSKELDQLNQDLKKYKELEQEINDLLIIGQEDQADPSVNLREEIVVQLIPVEKKLIEFEKLIFLQGKYDQRNALISIFAGAGGIDAQDWTEMLLKMYLKYAEKKGWASKIIEHSKGSEAGMKSVTLEIQGEFAYGFLKTEAGVHRLVRISPFDAEKMRHTSFALVEVLPELKDVKVNINPDDLRVDTFLSSGPGGQNMQKNQTAVRIVHLPTGLKASCEAARSQTKNKEKALEILKGKIYQYQKAQKEEEKERLRGEHKSASWGNQIRSYVIHPYKMVKDLRTGYETDQIEDILDGNLEEIIASCLKIKKINND
jgi:peptide chain release factor 2